MMCMSMYIWHFEGRTPRVNEHTFLCSQISSRKNTRSFMCESTYTGIKYIPKTKENTVMSI